jgi:metallo-beta-lactamase class B
MPRKALFWTRQSEFEAGGSMKVLSSVALLMFFLGTDALAQYAPANLEWNRPVEPFRIVGNVYYVGASDVSAFLFATPAGHILLDTGFRETVPILENNIRELGFRFEDVRLLLASHAHYDHAGGIAEVKARTKARLLVNPAETDLFMHGGKGDFAFGDKYAFPPVRPDGRIHDGEAIGLGGTVLLAHFTPGHTKGCTSYSARIREGARTYDVVFPCSMTAPGYRLKANKRYPGLISDFEASFDKLSALACDIFVGGHSWDFGLEAKRRKLQAGTADNPFVDPNGYRQWLAKSRSAFHSQLAEEDKQKQPEPQLKRRE